MDAAEHIRLTESYSARNYSPLDVVVAEGQGAWLTDVAGKRYLDLLSAYSAMNFGHSNPRFVAAAIDQLKRLTLTSRAFYNDQLGPFCKALADLCGMESVLIMNTGAEAVETSIKAARKWGYDVKGVAENQANIICFENNFAGRTISLISFSTSPSARKGFGPLTPGFKIAPFGDALSLEKLVDSNTVAVLVEPIQGEGGIIIPPEGFLRQVREFCSVHNLLMISDEIQTGLCRTGKVLASEHEGVKADIYVVGKSLGGGIVPISAIISRHDIMKVFGPGTHGSTFGGNPFACRIGREVIDYIHEEKPHDRAVELGDYFVSKLRQIKSGRIKNIRGRGLMVGLDIAAEAGKAREYCNKLKERGVLCKDTREQTMRFAPPLVIEKKELDWALEQIEAVLCA